MEHSKRAIWLACLDETDGPRLVSIAQEHVRLVKEMPAPWHGNSYGKGDPFAVTREILANRINQLREERDVIIARYDPNED